MWIPECFRKIPEMVKGKQILQVVSFPSILLMLSWNTENEVKVPDLTATRQVKDLTGCQIFT